MDISEVKGHLHHLLGGSFDEAAHLLLQALVAGAEIRPPREPMMSSELKSTYNVRRKHLLAANKRMPGYDLVAELFSSLPEQSWWLIGVEGSPVGGVIVLSHDGKCVGCFAYED